MIASVTVNQFTLLVPSCETMATPINGGQS